MPADQEIKPTRQRIAVVAVGEGFQPAAQSLAAHLGVPLLREVPDKDAGAPELLLLLDDNGLTLTDGTMRLQPDLSSLARRAVPGKVQRELLVRAAKLKAGPHGLRAIDATAGFGSDALLLAAAGFEVTLYERDPVIAALAADALRRARELPQLDSAASRMTLLEGDSIAALQALSKPVDVVLLDPMFPERRKSASVKKKFQLLHRLERPCDNEDELLQAALDAHPRKVVIKRPLKGPYLAGKKPSYSISGKSVRYDCLVL